MAAPFSPLASAEIDALLDGREHLAAALRALWPGARRSALLQRVALGLVVEIAAVDAARRQIEQAVGL